MAKQSVTGTLVKLADSGVGIVRIGWKSGAKFAYFKPRDLKGYAGETWSELASIGFKPGRALQMDVDVGPEGEVHHVSSVRFAGH